MAALDYAPAIAVLPFLSFVIALFAGRVLPKKGALAGIIATAGSLLLSAWTVLAVAGGATVNTRLYTFAATGNFDLHLGVLIDPLAALMLLIVSLVSFLVHVFSLGFMNDQNETGIPRYYAGLGLFTASMLGFVMADNLFMAFMFFEMVGFCSWLLIGHWFKRDAPASAAKKAFLVTRFGDYFLLVGLVGILATFGTASFAGQGSFPALAEAALSRNLVGLTTFGLSPAGWFSILGLLVLGGVIGKSAQFPLHTWLPDAMEGPTPVSALIHAATMVAAGVYLVARMYGFYALLPTVLAVIALVGGFTALFAASMAVVKRDIKQVLAYSTISQYGYMTLALGAGGYTAAVFHLMTHAFFKALLFLGAGSVIIATHHTQDMWDLGGLKDRLPTTYWTFVAASLALAGIFPFAGFWSKDEVLLEALSAGLSSPVILVAYAFGLIAVFVTGFYTVRMVLLTFHGDPRSDAARNAHGVGWSVKAPLVVLGVLAVVAGFINMTPVASAFNVDVAFLEQWLTHGVGTANAEHYLELVEEFAGYHEASVSALLSALVSLVIALAGAGLAFALYRGRSPDAHTDRLGAAKTLLMHNYYQDEYQVWLANGTSRVARAVGTFDNGVVDGVVNGVSSVSLFSGSRVKRLQTGIVTNYATLLSLGLVVLLVAFGLLGGWF